MIQAGTWIGDTLWPALSFFARKRGLGARVTEVSLNPKVMNWGVRRRAVSCDTLCPVAMAVRKRALSSVSDGDRDEAKRGLCRRDNTLFRDHLGRAGRAGGRCWKNEVRSRVHVLGSISTPKPSKTGSRMAAIALETVAGETLGPEWNRWEAKSASD